MKGPLPSITAGSKKILKKQKKFTNIFLTLRMVCRIRFACCFLGFVCILASLLPTINAKTVSSDTEQLKESNSLGSETKVFSVSTRIHSLQRTLAALMSANRAESHAVTEERHEGSQKLTEARVSAHQAAEFISSANALLQSEKALKSEQVFHCITRP